MKYNCGEIQYVTIYITVHQSIIIWHDLSEKKRICPCRESNRDPSICTQRLCGLHYRVAHL